MRFQSPRHSGGTWKQNYFTLSDRCVMVAIHGGGGATHRGGLGASTGHLPAIRILTGRHAPLMLG